jgi:polyisoprenoid-binding protein YceI
MRTPAVTGSLTLSGTQVSKVSVKVDLTRLESKDDQPPGVPGVGNRLNSLRFAGLELSQFPDATFALSSPITLSAAPKVGETVSSSAKGKLTLHGVTKEVTIPIKARWNGSIIDVNGSLPIQLADYSITPPERPFVSVTDHGTMEFDLTFAK